jgi:hypothetical protein
MRVCGAGAREAGAQVLRRVEQLAQVLLLLLSAAPGPADALMG